MESILVSIKKILGISEDYEEFDQPIITAINSALFALWQLGVGQTDQPFVVYSDEQTWSEFVEEGKIEMCKSYVGLRVRLLFDPPMNSFLVDAINEQIQENAFRLIVGMDEYNSAQEWGDAILGYRFFNPNPKQLIVGDCVIRSMSRLFEEDWDTTYARVSLQGFKMKDMPSSNSVWAECLLENDFEPVMAICQYSDPPCTVWSFAEDHPHGRFLLFIGGHVVTVVDGDYYDTWDSGDEIPQYYWKEKT